MSSIFILPFQDVGSGIKPADGAKLLFWATDVVTPKDTFTTEAATIAHANPVIADSLGVFPEIWLVGEYVAVLTDKNDVQIWQSQPFESMLTNADIDAELAERAITKSTIAAAKADDDLFDSVGGYVRIAKNDKGLTIDSLYKVFAGHGTEDGSTGGAVLNSNTGTLFNLQLEFSGVANVAVWNAAGDKTTQDAVSIQAANDFLVSRGGGVLYFPGVPVDGDAYLTNTAINQTGHKITWQGDGRTSRILNLTNDLLLIGSPAQDVYDFNMRGIQLQATLGDVITLNTGTFWSISKVDQCYLLCGVATSVLKYLGTSGGLFDVGFFGGEIAQPASSTAYIIDVEGSVNVFSINKFDNVRFQTNGSPTLPNVRLACTGAGQFFFQNTFDSCNFEIPDAGAILAQGHDALNIRSCSAFDVTTTTNHMWELGSTGSGVSCRNTVLESVNRFGGALGVGFHDVFLDDTLHTTMIACEGTSASGIDHDINNKQVLIQSPGAATLTNLNTANSVVLDPAGTSTSVNQDINGVLQHSGTTLGFYSVTPVVQGAAQADTSGATLATVEAELNSLKQKFRNYGLMAL